MPISFSSLFHHQMNIVFRIDSRATIASCLSWYWGCAKLGCHLRKPEGEIYRRKSHTKGVFKDESLYIIQNSYKIHVPRKSPSRCVIHQKNGRNTHEYCAKSIWVCNQWHRSWKPSQYWNLNTQKIVTLSYVFGTITVLASIGIDSKTIQP